MLTSETKRRIDSCRDILVGKLPLPTDQVELITLALIYKFMDDLDEESVGMGGRRSFFTGALAPYRWRELMRQTVPAEERMTRFADGLELLGGGKKLRVPKKTGNRARRRRSIPPRTSLRSSATSIATPFSSFATAASSRSSSPNSAASPTRTARSWTRRRRGWRRCAG